MITEGSNQFVFTTGTTTTDEKLMYAYIPVQQPT